MIMINHVVFLDDDIVQNQILIDGYLKKHPLAFEAKTDVLHSPEFVLPLIKSIRLDMVVLDYYLSGVTSISIAAALRNLQPACKVWLYSGYNPEFLHDADRCLFHRCIEKDMGKGFNYLLDQIQMELKNHINIKIL